MKKVLRFSLFIALLFSIAITGCKKDEPEPEPTPTVNSYEVLSQFMVDENLDLDAMLASWVVAAEPITKGGIVNTDDFTIPDYHVFDIRAEADFKNGHIKNAINVPLNQVLIMAENYTDKPILVVCYTGQGAGHAVMALRLADFSNAQVLKWGMAGWNEVFSGPWNSNAGHENGNVAEGNPKWVTTEAPTPQNFVDPTWTSTFTEAGAILEERVDGMLNNGFQGISGDDVLADPSQYQIINFWSNEDYIAFGHFEGAFQIKPITLAGDIVKHLNPEVTTLIYCYTGQTSSMITAWLNVLGYDAKSIKFGVNHLNFDGLEAADKPHWHGPYEYEYEVEN